MKAKYTPSLHSGQLDIYRSRARFRVAVMGRRFGKTRLGVTEIVLACLGFRGQIDPVSPQVVLAAMPTLQMAKQVIWGPLVSLFESHPALALLGANINRSDHYIAVPGRPVIYVAGANDKNGDGLRGKRIYFFLGDEMQDFKPGLFDKVVIPAMADTDGSRALLTGTPKGQRNHLHELFTRWLTDDDYVSFNKPTLENPFIPRTFVEKQRKTLPPKVFRQEFYASFEAFEGQIYTELDKDKHSPAGLPDGQPDLVVMGVDFGDVNPAALVLGRYGSTWYVLEGWQNPTGLPVPGPVFDSQLVRLAAKHNVDFTYCDPSRPSSILDIRTLGRQYGLKGLQHTLAGYNRIEEGILQVHSLIYQGRLLFPKAVPGVILAPGVITASTVLDLMLGYHRATDKSGQVTEQVAEGQDDHLNDSLRYSLARPQGTLATE